LIGKISEKGLEKYDNLAKNNVAIIMTGGTLVSFYKSNSKRKF